MQSQLATENYIHKELQKFNITDLAIAEMSTNFMPLKIEGIEDKTGYHSVREARLLVKSKRVEVEKKRKELTSDALKFQRAINEEAKRIVTLLEPIESHLEAQEEAYNAEKERMKQEAERLEQLKLQERINCLMTVGFKFDGMFYAYILESFQQDQMQCEKEIIKFDLLQLKTMPDQIFEISFNDAKSKVDKSVAYVKELERIKEKERQKLLQQQKEEQERLELERQIEQQAAAKRLAEERARLNADRHQQEAERSQLENIRKEQEAERQRLEAIAQEQSENERQRLDAIAIEQQKKESMISKTQVDEYIPTNFETIPFINPIKILDDNLSKIAELISHYENYPGQDKYDDLYETGFEEGRKWLALEIRKIISGEKE